MSFDNQRSAVIRRVGPKVQCHWVVELLSPLQPNTAYPTNEVRGQWWLELYLEFDNWEEAVAKAVEWKLGGKVDHIVYDDRDEEAG